MHKEIEVRFLEIDKELLIKKLTELGAEDRGEDLLEEIIFYDKDLKWRDENKFVRLRKDKKHTVLSYKHHQTDGKAVRNVHDVEEIEFEVADFEKAEVFIEKLNLVAYRHQQKRRHCFVFNEVIIDIDTWPRIPTYVELEGVSEEKIKIVAERIGLDWNNVVFESARAVIEKIYNIPVGSMKWFTFDKFE
jgi:adenylate cyclase class 2